MTMETELNPRYQEILGQVVTDYIAGAQAVGSRQISKHIQSRLSPATVRNVLKDLDEMGYLKQPHISSGRVPTDKGLRFYVDTLVEKQPLSEQEEKELQAHYQIPERDVPSLLKKTGKAIARLSKYIGLVATPKLDQAIFKHIEFLPLSRGRLLGIFVAQTGTVENRVLETRDDLNLRDIEKINNYCNTLFYGLTLEEARAKIARELTKAHKEYDRLIARALIFSQELLGEGGPPELVVEGETQLLGTKGFSSVEQIKELLASLEEKQQLLNILDSCLASSGVRIFIGAEIRCEATRDLSLITAAYSQNNRLLGTIGVIGPNSMNYSKVIAIVDFTAKMVSDLLGT